MLALEIEAADATRSKQSPIRPTTDSTRLYLREIGRVHILNQDEEVSET
ncbi:MAG: hypothetical protein JO235_09310 [Chroococcidiopsidaceae cyanobacterium CP_BM_RX_35]|nr:hypothetical protein [Chroococcidiopsidaceae cyanobacterium CP_BM_RX_35]